MVLRFDTSGWEQLAPGAFRNADGDIAEVHGFGIPPDLPAALEDLDRLRRVTAASTAASGGGLIELDVVAIDGLPAIAQIVKLPQPHKDHGVVYLSAFTVPRADRSLVLKFICAETGVTGIRDTMVFDVFLRDYGQGRPIEEVVRMWARHPYAPQVSGGLPRNWSDDPSWDDQFPDHPLSRARRLLTTVGPTVELHPNFKSAPPWRG
ncbi:hypothetical protein [Nocardia sp. NPDC052566]|uniref:hypothetical protein n=1 Tax=Nocardia sp. NPDC052566 TaxID=3364330 RepID=UPI0037C54C62